MDMRRFLEILALFYCHQHGNVDCQMISHAPATAKSVPLTNPANADERKYLVVCFVAADKNLKGYLTARTHTLFCTYP
jgi:hypothetical protein